MSRSSFFAGKAFAFFIPCCRPGHRAGVHASSILLKLAWIPDQVREDTKKILKAVPLGRLYRGVNIHLPLAKFVADAKYDVSGSARVETVAPSAF